MSVVVLACCPHDVGSYVTHSPSCICHGVGLLALEFRGARMAVRVYRVELDESPSPTSG